jgi:SAM-dependent methyltransferase
MDISRLSGCGWASFRPELFLGEPGRQSRNLSSQFLSILRDYSCGRSILELCCGAGRLCIDLGRDGYEVTGIDLDERMLAVAQDALGKESPQTQEWVRFIQEDVTRFVLGRTFDFVILEDDGFVYLLDQDDQIACLKRIRDHLRPDGKLLLVFATPQRELGLARGESAPSGPRFEYDPLRQIKTCPCSWTVVNGAGGPSQVHEGYERRRMTYPFELELLLRVSGLRVVERWGGLDRTAFQSPLEQDYHYLCRKA